ncbi:killer cell lectin-like receptor subfamily B member 1B allele C [Hemicordylus capensis]|uniref:killer cell lectin-like receptor subfamily B member 1B allele C n=1 Tax=Hemicordylus capensis TaxID=884348 RepID=UPI00230405DA|nr:killer cell lectin-like receptor subfamily B member 1B allele C [Hemicordylus capensis]
MLMGWRMELNSVYVDLNLPSEPSSAKMLHPPQVFNGSQHFHWHQIALWIGWAGNLILVVTVILLAFQTRQLRDLLEKASPSEGPTNGSRNHNSLENVTHLRQFVCKTNNSNITEDSSCKLCPQNWFLHADKCYWISKKKQYWRKSKEDCRAKLSHLAVIQNQEELAFIGNISRGYSLLWIGLEVTLFPARNWTWVNGSSSDGKLLQNLGPAEANCCGQLNGKKIIPQPCNTMAMWICETKAVLI